MPPELHVEPSGIDMSRILADRPAIRVFNRQRFEMEQIDAIVYEDRANHIIAGYKDVRRDEFWVPGHMPGYALLPGVLLCEAAAQVCSYYVSKYKIVEGDIFGFGGMEEVRFRGVVRPGDRVLLVGKGIKLNRRQAIFNVQGFVGATMVFHGDIIGMPLMLPKENSQSAQDSPASA